MRLGDFRNHAVVEWLFYGNYFYGCCAVALSMEASLQQGYPLNDWLYYAMVFLCTTLFYTYPYVRRRPLPGQNARSNWYARHFNRAKISQVLLTVLVLCGLVYYAVTEGQMLLDLPLRQWLWPMIFPLVGFLYYGFTWLYGEYNLRRIGWLKPFLIGFTWAGWVTVYPVWSLVTENGEQYVPTLIAAFLFVKNFMFVTLLCVMFDVKDYASDHKSRVRTFVVRLGLRRTIFYVLLPLSVLGLGSYVTYGIVRHFHFMRIVLNIIPFVLLLWMAWSLRKRRSLLYYLVWVDGLMVVKAVCGILGMLYF